MGAVSNVAEAVAACAALSPMNRGKPKRSVPLRQKKSRRVVPGGTGTDRGWLGGLGRRQRGEVCLRLDNPLGSGPLKPSTALFGSSFAGDTM